GYGAKPWRQRGTRRPRAGAKSSPPASATGLDSVGTLTDKSHVAAGAGWPVRPVLPKPMIRSGSHSPQQAQRPGAGDSLGAVGCSELVEDVADVFFDGGEGHDQFVGDLLVGPARGQQPQHFQLTAAQRLAPPRPPTGTAGRA